MFYLVAGLCVVAIICVLRIKGSDIDYDLARGADDGAQKSSQSLGVLGSIKELFQSFGKLFRRKPVLVFLVSAVLFHFANAAMVPLVTELLGKGQGARTALLYTSGFMLASQLVFVVVAAVSGRLASKIGRHPLFAFALGALAVRGVLYTFTRNPFLLIAVQCMDGLGAGIFGVVAVLIVADLTKGTGAFLSNIVAGIIARHAGANVAFLFLGAIALAGLIFFWLLMPETKDAAQGARAVASA